MRLQGNAIQVKPDENPDKTKGGVINPAMLKKPNSGIVVACGPGCKITEKGDRIQYKRKGASVMVQDRQEYHFIIEEQIFFNHGQ